MAEKIAHGVEWHEARGEVMAEVMPAKAHDIRVLQDMSPRRLEPCGNFKHSGPVTRLFAPRPKDSHCLVIERHVTCLTSLGIGALDSEEPMGEIDGFPSEFQEFTSPKSRVYGKENRGRYMVPEVRDDDPGFRESLGLPLRSVSLRSRLFASIAEFLEAEDLPCLVNTHVGLSGFD